MILPISDPADPRIAHYTRMKERDLIYQGDLFVAESEQVVRRLIESGRHEILSILCIDRKAEMMHALVESQSIPVYSAPHALVNGVIGFKFHSGVMAVARRAKTQTLAEMADSWADKPVLLMILPEITKTDNLGALVRIAAGFSADAMLIGPRCCDPYYRQSVRVSMGSVFKIPILRSDDLLPDLQFLKNKANVDLVAMVADNNAADLRQIPVSRRVGVLLGHETDGLTPEVTNLCSHHAAIKMNPQVDSFNVSVAGGIAMHHFGAGRF